MPASLATVTRVTGGLFVELVGAPGYSYGPAVNAVGSVAVGDRVVVTSVDPDDPEALAVIAHLDGPAIPKPVNLAPLEARTDALAQRADDLEDTVGHLDAVTDALDARTTATEAALPGKVDTTDPRLGLVGEVRALAHAGLPAGWLRCEGGTFNSVDHPDLAAALGDTYGAHVGTTYRLPDYRGRSLIGVGTATGATGATAHPLTGVGSAGGEETHTLTVAEMPSHTHATSSPGWAATGTGTDLNFGTGNWKADQPTQSSGSGGAHNNMHPYRTAYFIIKT